MLVGWGISIRRACEALRFDPSSYHYKSRRTGQAALELRIREICETRVRYGYRRVHVLLRREGWQGLCCTNPFWDSSHESSVVAGIHEQTYTPDLQDQELASLQ